MYRQCTDVVDHQALCSAGSSPYHFAEPGEASCCHDLLKSLSQQDNNAETSEFRGDVPPKKAKSPLSPGVGDSGHLHETTVGSQGYFSGTTADYSSYSYRSKIATFSSGISEAYTKPGLQRATFKGGADKTDRGHMHKPWNVDKCIEPVESPDAAVHRDQITSIDPNQQKPHLQIAKHEKVIKPDEKGERKVVDCYRKTSYAVLIGNTVRVYDTKMYAALPLHNKCMVKERVKDASGNTRVKMSLKTLQSRLV